MPSADAAASTPVHGTGPLDQADFGFVLNQDLSVIRTMQAGLHQPGCTHVLLGAEECRIINMNRHLERYLVRTPLDFGHGDLAVAGSSELRVGTSTRCGP